MTEVAQKDLAWSSGWAAAALILLPLAAGLLTGDVVWDAADFPYVFVAILLVVAVGSSEVATRIPGAHAYRAGVGAWLAATFILLWMNLAVGIVGTEDNTVNLMYIAVPAVGLAGAIAARFEPEGMVRASVATALAQITVAVLAQIAGHFTWVLTGFFVLLWLVSASLFRKAARTS